MPPPDARKAAARCPSLATTHQPLESCARRAGATKAATTPSLHLHFPFATCSQRELLFRAPAGKTEQKGSFVAMGEPVPTAPLAAEMVLAEKVFEVATASPAQKQQRTEELVKLITEKSAQLVVVCALVHRLYCREVCLKRRHRNTVRHGQVLHALLWTLRLEGGRGEAEGHEREGRGGAQGCQRQVRAFCAPLRRLLVAPVAERSPPSLAGSPTPRQI